MTAAVADHKHDVYDPGGGAWGDAWDVQVDHHAARTVRIDLMGAGFLPWRREVGSREVVALVITLREVAPAIEYLDAGHNFRRTIRKTGRGVADDAKGVFAFEHRVRASEIVGSSSPGRAAERWKSNRA